MLNEHMYKSKMKNMRCLFSLYAFLSICFMVQISAESRGKPMSVLFIVSDDLRPALASYGNTIVQTPNLDKLAGRSVRFTTATSQLAVCAPSRTSFLTGRRPDTTKQFSNKGATYWRENAGNFTTLPQHFKNAGYMSVSVGKIFHPGSLQGVYSVILQFFYLISTPCKQLKTKNFQP